MTIRRTFRRYVDGYGPISNQLIKNLNGIDEYLEQKRIIFVNNFTQKFENYINNYVDLGKKPYEFLNDYIANKLNNNNYLLNLLKDYAILIKKDKEDNLKVFSNNINQINNNLNIYFENIENNINEINNDYLCNNYLQDYNSFLEYPNEINIRLSYILNEFNNFSKKLKEEILQNYNNKIINHIELINNYSLIFTKNNYNFITNEIFPNKIFNEYFEIKFGIINTSFVEINFNDSFNNYSFISIEYDKNNNKIIDNLTKFIDDIESIIYENFTNYTYLITDYSKYNFYIIKLREAIYYSRNALNLFEDLEFKYTIKEKDLLNKLNITTDFHINNIMNQSLNKLNFMNEKTYSQLNDYFKYYKDRLNPYIINNIDYNDNLVQLIDILNDTITISDNYENTYIKEIDKILDNINETLVSEFLKILNEGEYNYNYSNYHNYFNILLDNIKGCFDLLLKDSYKFGYNFHFTNSFLDEVDKLHMNKNLYFKNLIKDFQMNYNFNFYNFSLDLSEYTEKYMEDIHENHFNFTYDYVNALENFLDNKSYNEIINKLNELEEIVKKGLSSIFDDFIYNLDKNKTEYIQKEYIEELYYNRSECANYSLDHLEDEEQIIYLDFNNCSLLNESRNNSFINKTNNETICPFFNKTDFILYCNDSNYFNQKEFYYENVTNEEDLSKLINKLIKTLEFYFNQIIISENLYNNTIESYEKNLSLNSYSNFNITIDIFEYELSDFEMAGEILVYYDQNEYKKFLNELLLKEFNNSIFEFINNFIKKDIEFDINIDIIQKYNIKYFLFEKKLKNELQYYLYLLNN